MISLRLFSPRHVKKHLLEAETRRRHMTQYLSTNASNLKREFILWGANLFCVAFHHLTSEIFCSRDHDTGPSDVQNLKKMRLLKFLSMPG